MPFLLDLYFPTRAQNQDFNPGQSAWLDLIKFRAEPIGQEQSPDLIKFRDYGPGKIKFTNYMEEICQMNLTDIEIVAESISISENSSQNLIYNKTRFVPTKNKVRKKKRT